MKFTCDDFYFLQLADFLLNYLFNQRENEMFFLWYSISAVSLFSEAAAE